MKNEKPFIVPSSATLLITMVKGTSCETICFAPGPDHELPLVAAVNALIQAQPLED
jgi:hypothetical protein